MAVKISAYKQLSQLWMEFTSLIIDPRLINCEIPYCALCGNSGILDTTQSAKTPGGIPCGIRAFCICPNGRARRKINKGRKYGESSDITKP